MIREKGTKSGKLLDVDFFPVNRAGRRVPERQPKSKPSSEEQEKYNRERATKNFVRLVNVNFDENDYFGHFSYSVNEAPQDEEQAHKDIANYFRRVNYYRKSKGLANARYIVVIEKQEYKKPELKDHYNYHFHLFIGSDGMTRDEYEALWTKGEIVRMDKFRPRWFGPKAAATYLRKDPQGRKSWYPSKGLKKPKGLKPRDGKLSKRTVEKMAKLHRDDKDYWEKRYPGYEFVDCLARFNEYNSHWYVSVMMYEKEKPNPKSNIKNTRKRI